jgi:hypothetical protein
MPMTYAQIDLHFFERPEVIAVDYLEQNVYLRLVLLSRRLLSDGLIHRLQVPSCLHPIAPKRQLKAIAELVRVGLLETNDEGWRIPLHDFAKFGPLRDEIEAKRAREATKKQAQRAKTKGVPGMSPGDTVHPERKSDWANPVSNGIAGFVSDLSPGDNTEGFLGVPQRREEQRTAEQRTLPETDKSVSVIAGELVDQSRVASTDAVLIDQLPPWDRAYNQACEVWGSDAAQRYAKAFATEIVKVHKRCGKDPAGLVRLANAVLRYQGIMSIEALTMQTRAQLISRLHTLAELQPTTAELKRNWKRITETGGPDLGQRLERLIATWHGDPNPKTPNSAAHRMLKISKDNLAAIDEVEASPPGLTQAEMLAALEQTNKARQAELAGEGDR